MGIGGSALAVALAFLVTHFGGERWERLGPRGRGVHLRRSWGAACLAAAAGLVAWLESTPLGWVPGGDTPRALALAAGLYALAVPLLLLANRRPAPRYPEVLGLEQPGVALLSALSWSAYLLGYELCLRGAFQTRLVEALGAPQALALASALYGLAHLHKAPGEAFASVGMGFVFGGLALVGGSIWAPLLLHVAIALTNDHLAARSRRAWSRPAPAPTPATLEEALA